MNNKDYLEKIKPLYKNLKYFYIKNNILTLHLTKDFQISLNNTDLSKLNQIIFSLEPYEIFQILYMFELNYNKDLTDIEISFIKKYTQKYIDLDRENKNNSGAEININRLWCLGIPISYSYFEEFQKNPASEIINNILNEELIKDTSSNSKYPALVLKKNDNPNFEMEEQVNTINEVAKAGFATIMLIAGTIISTCIYLIYFFSR